MGTVHIMKQLLVEVEGVITHRPYSVKHGPFLSSVTDVPNKQSPFENPLQYSAAVGTNVLLYLPRLLLMNTLASTGLGITAPVVRQGQSFRVIFTLVKYFLLFQVFRTIGENWRWREHDVTR